MQRAHIVPKTVRRFRVTTDSRKTKASPNLLGRVFTAERPNTRWLTDVTFIPSRAGWLYLAAILDLHSRAIVGWAMSDRIDRALVTDALLMAIEHPRQPLTSYFRSAARSTRSRTIALRSSSVRFASA